MDKEIVRAGVPILGICYGMQLLARDVGAELVQLDHAEYGPATLMVADRATPLFDGVPEESRVWMSHGDSVVELPSGYLALASTARCHVAAMGNPKKKIYGVQFHPEVVHSEYGRTVLDNFLHQIAGFGQRLGDGVVLRDVGAGDPLRVSAATRRSARSPGASTRRLPRRWSRVRSANS